MMSIEELKKAKIVYYGAKKNYVVALETCDKANKACAETLKTFNKAWKVFHEAKKALNDAGK